MERRIAHPEIWDFTVVTTITSIFLANKDTKRKADLKLCSGVINYFAGYYEDSQRHEVFTKQLGFVCYLTISAAQSVRDVCVW